MRKIKLLLLTVFVLLLSVSLFACGGDPSNGGADDSNTGSNYTYTLRDNDTYQITSYNGNEKAVTLPETYNGKTVTSVAEGAFENNATIETLVVPDVYTKIEINAFSNCKNLTSIDISKNIGLEYGIEDPFRGCDNIKSCIIPTDYLETIYNLNIETLIIDSGEFPVNYSFIFDNLKYLEIKPEVTNVVSHYNSIFPSIETFIGPSTGVILDVSRAEKLAKKIVINSGDRLDFLPKAEEVYIGKTVNNIDFIESMSKTNKIVVDEENNTYASEGNCILTKDKKTLIASCKTTVIPECVETIGINSFLWYEGSTSITIPSSVKVIEGLAFQSAKIKNVNFAENSQLTTIDSSAFSCSDLETIDIPDSVKTIGSQPFDTCQKLTYIALPPSTKIINKHMFMELPMLKSINWRELTSLEEIQDEAFISCTNFSDIELPETVKKIGNRAFYRTGATKVVIPKGVEMIDEGAFCNMQNLTEVIFPSDLNMTVLPRLVFSQCPKLNNVVIPEKIKTLDDGCFSDCTGLTNIDLNVVRKINKEAFKGCTGLTNLELPITVCEIQENAFMGTSTNFVITTGNHELRKHISGNGLYGINVVVDETQRIRTTYFDCVIYKGEMYIYNYDNPSKDVDIPKQITIEKDGKYTDYKVVWISLAFRQSSINSVYIPNTIEYINVKTFMEPDKIKFYCEAPSQPIGWEEGWNGTSVPKWNVPPEDYIAN